MILIDATTTRWEPPAAPHARPEFRLRVVTAPCGWAATLCGNLDELHELRKAVARLIESAPQLEEVETL